MLKRINDTLSGVAMTILGAVFLIISFVLKLTGTTVLVDPAWLTVIICGLPLACLSIWRIVHNPGLKKISSALLITIAMMAAIGIGDIFAAGEVAFIMAIGAILEDKTADRAKKGLHKLISLAPLMGRKISDNKEEMIDARLIRPADILRVLPGEAIPVDGTIIKGSSSIDQSIMTGEALPVDKSAGDTVFGGTINGFGTIDICAAKVGEDSSLQKLIRLVEEAGNKKAPMERIADKCATWLVPAALLIAAAAGLVTQDIIRAVTVLVVFCPCALVLATPTAVMAAIGQAAKYGVIIKSGEALERMGKVDTVAFDKTGTLTRGNLTVTDIQPLSENMDIDQLLSMAASAEAYSEHPLAKGILAYAKEQQVKLYKAEHFQMIPGKGIKAKTDGRLLICGTRNFIRENQIPVEESAEAVMDRLRNQGKAVILIADECRLLGVIALSDTLRDSSKKTIAELKGADTRVILLTGDNRQSALYFAGQAGIDDVRAELLPAGKIEEIQKLQTEGRNVCMVGDGVNDAPALKAAHVGVAMGTIGSDIAIDTADIALMGDDIDKISYLKRLSNAAVRTIKASIGLSLCINLAAISLSVAGILTPTTGALVHNAGSLFVVLLAALLYDRKF